jgi:hypothetical protein
MKKIITNHEIAKKVIEALDADKEHEYEKISLEKLVDLIDLGRSPEEEAEPVDEEVLNRYIEGYKESLEITV